MQFVGKYNKYIVSYYKHSITKIYVFMKYLSKYFAFVGLISLVSFTVMDTALCQTEPTQKRLAGIRLHLGSFNDAYHNLSPDGLVNMIKGGYDGVFDLNNYRESYYNNYSVLSGGNVGIDLILNPKKPLFGTKIQQQVRLGLSANIDREVMLDMVENASEPKYDDFYYTEGVTLCLLESEFIVQGSYLLTLPVINNKVNFYGGLGGSFGTTFNNDFIFIGLSDEYLQVKNSHYLRGYGTIGANVRFGKIQLDLEGIFGAGWQLIHDRENNFLANTRGIQLGVTYLLGRQQI